MISPVKELCIEYHFTQKALAERFGIPLRTLEQWCAGKRNAPEYVVAMMRTILEFENKQ